MLRSICHILNEAVLLLLRQLPVVMNGAILRSSVITEFILHRFTSSSSSSTLTTKPSLATLNRTRQLPSSQTMDLLKQLTRNSKMQKKNFQLIFDRFDQPFSDCEVVDLNELFRDSSDQTVISPQRKTTQRAPSHKSKNKRKCRKPSKLVVATGKKFSKYQTRSVIKRKCSKSNKDTATRHARTSKTARKSNGRVKNIFRSPLPNRNVIGSVESRNKSVFCEPPTVMDLDVSNSDDDDNITDVDTDDEDVYNKSEFCTPPTIIEVNPLISRSGFCTPPTVIKKKLNGNFNQNKKKQSDIWQECFSRYYAPVNNPTLTKSQRITKALSRWQKHFAYMFPRSPSP